MVLEGQGHEKMDQPLKGIHKHIISNTQSSTRLVYWYRPHTRDPCREEKEDETRQWDGLESCSGLLCLGEGESRGSHSFQGDCLWGVLSLFIFLSLSLFSHSFTLVS